MNAINNYEMIIAHPVNKEQKNTIKAFFKALKIKFEISEPTYNPDFIDKIKKSRNEFKEGKSTRVKKENLTQFLDDL